MKDLFNSSTISRLLPLLLLTLIYSCSIGRKLTPQSDIEAYDTGRESSEVRILVASRDSEFKVDVAGKVGAALIEEDVFVRFIGIDQLGGVDASGWSAVIVMTTCIAWGLDSTTESFLDANGDSPNIVVLVTSGDGGWLPEMEGRRFDAVTSASVMEDAGMVAEKILDKVRAIIAASGGA